MALLSDPALLLLDEPTTGMDVEGRRTFWSAIRRDAEQGRTVLFATHYLEEADQYADRIVLISQGRIVADGTGSEIRALAAGRTVRATLARRRHRSRSAAIGGVDGVEVRGETVLVHAKDSDAVARYLLTETDARDLEITSQGSRGRLPEPDRTTREAMSTVTTARPSTPTTRRVPPFGGFNPTVLGIELQADAAQPPHDLLHAGLPGRPVLRVRRHRRAGTTPVGHGNVAAYIMVSMALYGAALTAASAGAMVAMERAMGWSRQLRLTPLSPVVYILMKAIVALVMGALAVAVGQRRRHRPGQARHAGRRLGRLRRAARGLHAGLRRARRLRRLPRSRRERHADPRPRPGAHVVPRQRVHPDRRPHQPDLAHRAVDADVRRRRDQPGRR